MANLDDLAAEAAPAPAPMEGQGAPTAPAGPDLAAIRLLALQVVRAGGRVACKAARVSALEADEENALADAVANVVQFYDVSALDPKAAAWIGLGLTALGVVSNRVSLAPPPPVNDDTTAVRAPENAEEVVAAQHAAVEALMGGGDASASAA